MLFRSQRADVTDLVFTAKDGTELSVDARFETVAWPDRLALILAARPRAPHRRAAMEIRLAAPTPYFLGLLTHSMAFPVYRPALEQHGERHARAGTLVSNGAYRLADWTVQSHIRAERNPHYWNDANTTIDEVWYYPVDNQDAELRRYRAGDDHAE